ncbi:MAG: hypothetical protein A2V67_19005 [Deltaproteobacteria bacterium RBG_13_61_14]|nr:MAG: hypothetical protein A2V67_19005 [Deltaproteobacteria bacterium RBG_13_61_14]
MPAKNPRLSSVVEKPLYQWLKQSAEREGTSLSTRVRDLLRIARELEEDAFWTEAGEKRLRTFRRRTAVEHDQAWGRKK